MSPPNWPLFLLALKEAVGRHKVWTQVSFFSNFIFFVIQVKQSNY